MQVIEIDALEHEVEQLLIDWNLVGQGSVRCRSPLEELFQEVGELFEVWQLLLDVFVECVLQEQA